MRINTVKKIINFVQDTIGLDLALVVILATLLTIFALTLPDGNILRIIFGLPFLLFLPGYSLVSALWTKKSELDGLDRTALSLGLSIALVALVGLGLNYTPWGINLTSVVASLYGLILVLVIITWVRRAQLSLEERFQLRSGIIYDTLDAFSYVDKLMILLVVVAVVIGGTMLFYVAMNPPKERFTELYLLDGNGTTGNYPSTLEVNESASIIITVVSHEGQNTDYNIKANLVPETGNNRTLAEYPFSLADEGKWQQVLNFSVNESGMFKLEVALFKSDETKPYATTHIWIDVRT